MKTIKYLLLPFKKHLYIFIVLFILFSTTSIYLHISVYHAYPYSLFLASHGYLLAYTTTLLLSMFPKTINKIITLIIVIGASLFFILDFYCIYHLQTPFDADFATLLMTTNFKEANEFIDSMIPISFIAINICFFLILGVCYYIVKHFCSIGYKIASILFIFVIISAYALYRNPSVYIHGIIGKITAIASYEIPDNLRSYFSHPQLITLRQTPKNIVVIIGESHSKHHSSLYGYNKCTNPKLKKLATDSTLYIFNNVTSSALTTMSSFKYMMSSYGPNTKEKDKNWYEHILLIDVLEQANYQTHWFSNHAKAGISNNVTRLFAEACNDNHFYGNRIVVGR